jgi:hypothetical protein
MAGSSKYEAKEKLFRKNVLIEANLFFVPLSSFFILFIMFFAFQPMVKPIWAQFQIDSFYAKGIISMQLPPDMKLNIEKNLVSTSNHNINKNTGQVQNDNNLTKNNNQTNASNKQLIENQPYLLQGKWELQVTKGNPESFKTLIALIKGQKILNVFGILNLQNTQYIQLNNMGNEIINGKVDLKSAGLINQTIKDVDAVISIQGFTQLRIDLDDANTYPFFTKAVIVGTTEILVDGSGNMIIGPAPPPPSIQSQQRSVPIPY